ncbi:MAG: hypothetical protein AAB533_01410 [Patescibacteria group bacterium]
MAHDVLLLSPSYGRMAHQETRERNALLVECLDPMYLYPQGSMTEVIEYMKKGGYSEPLSEDMVSEGRMIYRNIYRYFTDEHFRGNVDIFFSSDRKKGSYGRHLGIFCFCRDNPEVKTWEDVEAKMALVAGRQDAEVLHEATQAIMDGAPQHGELSLMETLTLTLAEAHEAIRRIETQVGLCISQQRQREEHDKQTIADLQRENAYLKRRLEEWLRHGEVAIKGVADMQNRGKHIEYMLLLTAHNLPETTIASPGGWQKELPIVYSRERDAFCDRLQSDAYSKGEKEQIAKGARFLARFGARHPSLHTETFRRELPGTPRGIGDFSYSRASHDLRFTWKQIGDAVHIFCIYKHQSGGGSALPDIR